MALIKSVKGIGKTKTSLRRLAVYVGEKAYACSGLNCSDNFNSITEEFEVTKKFYKKEDGRQYKHIIQAFSKDEITPDHAHEIGIEFAKSFKGFEVFIATHTDREHIHNHIVLNSVNFETGLKYHESKHDLEILKSISDEICLRNNLSVIDRTLKTKNISTYDINTYKLLEDVKQKNKKSDLIELALKIKSISSNSSSKEEFISNFEKENYSVQWSKEKKHITFTIPNNLLVGKKNKFRLENINKYFKQNIFTKEGLENEFGRLREEKRENSNSFTTGTTKDIKKGIKRTIYNSRTIDKGFER